MGFNTVAFVLNDFAKEIVECPYQVASLCYKHGHYLTEKGCEVCANEKPSSQD